MLKVVEIISAAIEDGLRRIKFLRLGKDDVQTSYQANPAGIDSHPLKGLKAIHAPTGEKGEDVIIGYINEDLLADEGEIRLFSVDADGALMGYVMAKKDGDVEINGDADNMVRYSELETAFNELKGDLNDLITAYNSHIHITTATVAATPTPGIISATVSTGTPSAADISGAKIDDVKTN